MPAPSIVQHKASFGTNVTTLTVTLSSSVGAGHMLVVWIGVQQASTINTPTMTGETLTKVTGATDTGFSGNGQVACYATNSASGGQTQVTATIVTSADLHVHVLEVSGQSGSPQDASGNTHSTSGSTPPSVSTSGATTTSTDLVTAFFYCNAINTTFTADSPYSQTDQTNNTTGGDVAYSETRTTSSTGTQTAAPTMGTVTFWSGGILAIAGGTVTPAFEDDSFKQYQPLPFEPVVCVW